jgi:hypothetical protein
MGWWTDGMVDRWDGGQMGWWTDGVVDRWGGRQMVDQRGSTLRTDTQDRPCKSWAGSARRLQHASWQVVVWITGPTHTAPIPHRRRPMHRRCGNHPSSNPSTQQPRAALDAMFRPHLTSHIPQCLVALIYSILRIVIVGAHIWSQRGRCRWRACVSLSVHVDSKSRGFFLD